MPTGWGTRRRPTQCVPPNSPYNVCMEDWQDDPQIRPGLERLSGAIDRFEAMMDERDAVEAFIRKEVEQYGGKIREVFTDAVDAEFPEHPAQLSRKIIEKDWKSWDLNGKELTVWLR